MTLLHTSLFVTQTHMCNIQCGQRARQSRCVLIVATFQTWRCHQQRV